MELRHQRARRPEKPDSWRSRRAGAVITNRKERGFRDGVGTPTQQQRCIGGCLMVTTVRLTRTFSRAVVNTCEAWGNVVSNEGHLPNDPGELTDLIRRANSGSDDARGLLLELVYGELKRIAGRERQRQSIGDTLQTTTLVHEAYVKVFRGGSVAARDRDHFFALAATAMRHLIVDHLRGRRREKRKAAGHQVQLDALVERYERSAIDLIALNDALESLAAEDPTMAQAVELKFILNLPEADIARIVGLPLRTLQRYWEPTLLRLRRDIQ